jgi:hypothetical protein
LTPSVLVEPAGFLSISLVLGVPLEGLVGQIFDADTT